jgi:hypothetical protein
MVGTGAATKQSEHQMEQVREHSPRTAPSLQQQTIASTWSLTLDEIDPDAKTLMETAVLFDPDHVPCDLFLPSDPSYKCVSPLICPTSFAAR